MRVSSFDLSQARPELRPDFEALPPLRLTGAIAHAEDALLPHLRLGAALLTKTELSPAHRELAILRLAAVTGARYCRTQHDALAPAAGLSASEIAAAEEPSSRPASGASRSCSCFVSSTSYWPTTAPRRRAWRRSASTSASARSSS